MQQGNAVALVAPQQPAIIAIDEWSQARVDFVIQNYCGGAPPQVAAAFVALARKRRLSPEEKQIYLIKRGDKWGPETSIDGYRLIAERTEAYAGKDRPVFGPIVDGHPESAEVTVYKIVQGQRVGFTGLAYWDEFCPKSPQDFMWKQMPRHMLAKVAEAQALRSGFPADLSGIYVTEEMQQAVDDRRPATTVREEKPKGAAPKAVPARATAAKSANGMATPQQVKAILDIAKRKRLGEADVAVLLGGEGWAERTTESQAADWISWLGSAKTEDIDKQMAKAMEDAEASVEVDADGEVIDGETGEIVG